mgnify:FL=1
MKKSIFLLLFMLIYSQTAAQKTWSDPEITVKDIQGHLKYLADDKMKGRFTGSPEEKEAANYIKDSFVKDGLKPAFGDSYFQDFDFIERIDLTKNNSLELIFDGKTKTLELRKDFTTAPFSGVKSGEFDLVFAGYGISSEKLNYDDYAGIDVKNKVVVVMRYNPEYDSSKTEFDRYSSYRVKANTAKEKGAAGIIFVNPPHPKNEADELMELRFDGAMGIDELAAFQVKKDVIEELLSFKGKDFADIQKGIDDSKTPNSFSLDSEKVKLSTETKYVHNKGRNVAAILEGSDPILKNEYIVIGGHYDHLGIDQLKTASMYKGDVPMIHNGADDNASGTTGVLEAAEKLAAKKAEIKRSIIFITFSGEEMGLLGSTYFTNNSPVELEAITSMLNMDMIGRLDSVNSLTVIGTGTSSIWKDLLNKENKYAFQLGMNDAGSGGSDHQSFTNKNIPVLFFFTGTHTDYHKPSDDYDKINFDGLRKVAELASDIALDNANSEKRPDFVKVEAPSMRGAARSKVTVGTVPEFGYNGKGYKISGVSEGGSAQKAGMKPGDIMIKFGSKTIDNIYDFMYAIGECNPGDKVDVVVLRDDKEVTLNMEMQAK